MPIARSTLYIRKDDETEEPIYRHDIENESFYGVFGVADDFAPMDLREVEWEEIDGKLANGKSFVKTVKRWKLRVDVFEVD